jgi:hypothetical protein
MQGAGPATCTKVRDGQGVARACSSGILWILFLQGCVETGCRGEDHNTTTATRHEPRDRTAATWQEPLVEKETRRCVLKIEDPTLID